MNATSEGVATAEIDERSKTSLLQIRIADELRAALATEAKAMGVSASAFARMAILEKIRRARAERCG